MPELPEVENYRIYIEGTVLDCPISAIEVLDYRLIKKPEPAFQKALVNNKFISTKRVGKYLFLLTTSDAIMVMHFGLTGNLEYFKDDEDRPKYAQVLLHFDNGFTLAYLSRRKFGWLDLTNSVEDFRKLKKLGKDATEVTFEEFYQPLRKSKAPIKPRLLDQKHFAGVGNWIADEILYQSQIHPETRIDKLSETDFQLLYDKMQHILSVALKHQAVFNKFPDYFLIHNRKDGGTCFHTGEELVRLEVGGRGTFVSPKWQPIKT
ncbi:MAG: Fpg/Nei family DNA glycosylase [Cyclobacteriaceae bacterium]